MFEDFFHTERHRVNISYNWRCNVNLDLSDKILLDIFIYVESRFKNNMSGKVTSTTAYIMAQQ